MFADDANLSFTHKDIRYLFQIVNQELEKTSTNGLFQINHSFIHNYIIYGNINWEITNRTNLEKNRQSTKTCHQNHLL